MAGEVVGLVLKSRVGHASVSVLPPQVRQEVLVLMTPQGAWALVALFPLPLSPYPHPTQEQNLQQKPGQGSSYVEFPHVLRVATGKKAPMEKQIHILSYSSVKRITEERFPDAPHVDTFCS